MSFEDQVAGYFDWVQRKGSVLHWLASSMFVRSPRYADLSLSHVRRTGEQPKQKACKPL